MIDGSVSEPDCTIAILAPTGRDATIAAAVLREGGVVQHAVACADTSRLLAMLDDATCFVVATEEALRHADLRPMAEFVSAQPAWSDLPFIILTGRGGGPERNPAAARLSTALGNVTFVERPFHPVTFVSVARTALRGRLRQFEARARIAQLHENEQNLRNAMLAGRLGAWELEIGSGELTTSATCREVFGRGPQGAFSYADLLASIHPDDRPRMQASVAASEATGHDYMIEYRNIWPDGSEHWAEIRARVVERDGVKLRMVGVSSDVTERKLAEARLRQANESLEERVALRTRELSGAHATVLAEIAQRQRAEDQLRQAQKVEAIGQITGGVAHDFNNLLMAVLANLDLLRNRVRQDAQAQPLLEGAIQAARRGAALTQRLLAFTRQQELEVKPTDLSQLVRGMLELVERSVGDGIDIALQLAPGLPVALVDANQIELALLNLAVNARDAMPMGGVLNIGLDLARPRPEDELAAGDYLRLSVTDTGTGMDAATLKRAVDPFFSTKEPGKGTGLGLSMVHGLARQLLGELRLASTPGQGTHAELWMPAAAAGVRPPPAPEQAPERPRQARLNILFVEDDFIIALATRAMLKELGHNVTDVRSGPKALEVLERGEPVDLLITDFSMPRMTGVELAEKARELRPALPILLATGYMNMPEGSSISLPRLSKPYMLAELREKIDSVMSAAE